MTDKDHDKDKAAPPPPAAKPAAATHQPTLTGSLPPEAYMTEQEKAGLAGTTKAGPSEAEAKKKETK
jgi:hypothetical protein